jgi:predicted transcriptional regulator
MDGRKIRGRDLKALREEAGLSRSQLAVLIQCSEGHLRNMEMWGYEPSTVLAHRLRRQLSKALERPVSLDDFTDENDDSNGAAA